MGRISPYGYGESQAGDQKMHAHRAAHLLWIGPVPEGHDVDHLCHNADLTCKGGPTCGHRRCCEPTHLEAVTRRVNIERGNLGLAKKTHCVHGHEFTEENTWVDPKRGFRHCRLCNAARQRATNRRKRERAKATG